jgi:flagellar biosynthesis chaperone FliJ
MNDCIQVDELLLQLADYKNDYSSVAAEKLLRKCSTSWEAYRYLKERVQDAWLLARAYNVYMKHWKQVV